MKPALRLVEGEFTVHRLDPSAPIPHTVTGEPHCWIGRTEDELSIVCPSAVEIDGEKRESGWSCLKVVGPLDFELTGILAGIAGVLADAGVAIFALSTFDTDYVLVKAATMPRAVAALREAGYPIG